VGLPLPVDEHVEQRLRAVRGADELPEPILKLAASCRSLPRAHRAPQCRGAPPPVGAQEHLLDGGEIEELESLGAVHGAGKVS
jgi:hypothetical protein